MAVQTIIQSTIIRTERGPTISGTRITLYDILEFIKTGWPHSFIRDYFELTDDQLTAALTYISQHQDEIEHEYQQVIRDAEDARHYWEARNRERLAMIAKLPPPPGMEAAWAKLQAAKTKHEALDAYSN